MRCPGRVDGSDAAREGDAIYIPGYQSVEDDNRLWHAVERHSFASIICADDAGNPLSTLVPFVRRDGRLWMHLAAANPQASILADGRSVLCQFLGPHAYISPSWYVEPGDVPTWNFVQVAVTGRLRRLDGPEARWLLEETVAEYEGRRPRPVAVAEMSRTIDALVDGIRAFEVLVEGIDGRFKLSQNRNAADRRSVIAALSAGDDAQRQVADLMRAESQSAAED